MATNPPPPSDQTAALTTLCTSLRTLIPSTPFGPEAWYLVPCAIIAQSPAPERLATFYTHLTTAESLEPHALSLRLRDLLMKQVPLIGAPQVLCALIPLAEVDCVGAYGAGTATEAAAKTTGGGDGTTAAAAAAAGDGGAGLSESWRGLFSSSIPAIHARGTATIDTIYGSELLPRIFASFGGHTADVQFMELFAVYGLFLSGFETLSAVETELVVWATINCTGLRGPALWHLRGMGRLLGARGRDEAGEAMGRVKDLLRGVKVAMMESVEWCGEEMVRRSGLDGGRDGRGWCNVGDVLRELGGWGDDPLPR